MKIGVNGTEDDNMYEYNVGVQTQLLDNAEKFIKKENKLQYNLTMYMAVIKRYFR